MLIVICLRSEFNNILLTKVIIYNVDSTMSTFRVLNSNIISNNILLTKVIIYNVDSNMCTIINQSNYIISNYILLTKVIIL